jgi:hypothetical protein
MPLRYDATTNSVMQVAADGSASAAMAEAIRRSGRGVGALPAGGEPAERRVRVDPGNTLIARTSQHRLPHPSAE